MIKRIPAPDADGRAPARRRLWLWLAAAVICSVAFDAGRAAHGSSAESPEALAADLVWSLSQDDAVRAVTAFDDAIKPLLGPEELRHAWASLIAQLGPFRREAGVRRETASGSRLVYVTCEFQRGRMDAKVVFNAAGRITGLWFVPTVPPQELAGRSAEVPQGLRERELTVGDGAWVLPGTLTLPTGSGPFPALVLVHGSGPHDRDETIGANKPFRDLAWGLARRGIAVLRYEKRTKAHGMALAATKGELTVNEETVDDALAAVALLRETAEADPARIFVLGHSLGGMVLPRIGLRDPAIAGLIVMAGTTRPLEDVIVSQMRYLFALDGAVSDAEQAQLEQFTQQAAHVKDEALGPDTPPAELPFGVPARYWLDLRHYSPPELARQLKQPMLILQGERDYQVTLEDFAGWESALVSRPDVSFILYPTLNHLFIEGTGRSGPQEYAVAGHLAEAVLNDIATWIKAPGARQEDAEATRSRRGRTAPTP
jgi:hypothetical protein